MEPWIELVTALIRLELARSAADAAPTDDGYFSCEGDTPYWRLNAALKLLVCA